MCVQFIKCTGKMNFNHKEALSIKWYIISHLKDNEIGLCLVNNLLKTS
jgi:hypothetical protein